MKNFITFMFAALLFLAISCGSEEGPACDTEDAVVDVSNTDTVSKDCQDLCAKKGIDGDTCKAYCSDERKKGACYAACEGSAGHCKKVCYDKKDKGDVVDSPDDATATKADTVSTPDDVSGTNG